MLRFRHPRRISDKSSGDGLVGNKSTASERSQASGMARGRRQLSSEHIVGDGRAGDGGIGARESPEDRAGSSVSIKHFGIITQTLVKIAISNKLQLESPETRNTKFHIQN